MDDASRPTAYQDLLSPSQDPIKDWIALFMRVGGYFSLLGLPTILFILGFLLRIRWLKIHRQPHFYGRTAWIYWPSQFFLLAASISLFPLVFSSSISHGLIPSAILLIIALWTGMGLNKQEHRYEIRSSNYLFVFYLSTISTSALATLILFLDARTQEDTTPEALTVDATKSAHQLGLFTILLSTAFVFEAFPRKNTKVQIESRLKENMSNYQQANLASRLSYHYVQPIMTLGALRSLQWADVDNMAPKWLQTKVNYDMVSASWDKDVARYKASKGSKPPSFMFSVLKAYRHRLVGILTWRLVAYSLGYLPTILFGSLLKFVGDYSKAVKEGVEPPSVTSGLLIAAAMFVGTVSSSVLMAYSIQGHTDCGLEARAGTMAIVYRKSLRLSPQARQKSTLGEISNHMSVDAERWITACNFMPFIITIPFELAVTTFLLYRLVGWSMVAALAVFATVTPVQAKMADFMNTFSDQKLEVMDERMRITTEILSNIKIVKLYGWEDSFRKKIDAIRVRELVAQKWLATIRSILTIVFSSVTLLMALATFATYATVGGPGFTPGKITAEVIFMSITIFGLMNKPLGMTSHCISQTIAVRISCNRIQKFLLQEDIDTTIVERHDRQSPKPGQKKSDLVAVSIEKGTFAWEKEEVVPPSGTVAEELGEREPLLVGSGSATPVRPLLSDINLRVAEGSLTAIVGRVGQGKSSLLSAIMGEMYKKEGTVKVYGDLSYCPQQAWIINATVRDNILFGKAFDQELYDRVIFASGLRPDLDILSAGDQTEIGEKGINLSGGQKQRVSLARAAYQDADVYILDDPLSAVDAHVDQHLWQQLIGPEGMLKEKTRILVTHGVHHLEHVDQIVVLKDGRVSEIGKYQDLLEDRGGFYQLIKDYSITKKKSSRTVQGSNSETDAEDGSSERNTIVGEDADESKKDKDGKEDSGELVADEAMVDGKVGWKVWMIYARAVSLRKAILCIFMMVLSQGCHILTNFWLRYWISETEASDREGSQGRPVSFYLAGYGVLVGVYLCTDVFVNYVSEVVCGIQGSKTLFDQLMTRILRLPMSFFDTTPMGRILNRFSSDIDALDERLPEEFNDLFAFLSIIGGTLFVIAFSTPVFLIMVPFLLLIYLNIQEYFITTSLSLKRLSLTAKSPLFQHFSETLTGVASIRAMKGLSQQFIQKNDLQSDKIVQTTNLSCLSNRWLQVRLDILGGFTVFLAAALAVLNAGTLDPSLVGLALSYAINMVAFINYLVRTVGVVMSLLSSIERIDEYSHKPTEAPAVTGVRLPKQWPQEGKVVFKGYSARYREGLDLVVKDISFTVEPSEKVGIVGRTGAGKSSLTLALFRIIEAADSYWARASDPSAEGKTIKSDLLTSLGGESGGSIEIDGIDIATMGLRDLRQHLAIIPQDPTLFAGSIRDNLDPFQELSDRDLWEALERAHLKEHIASLAGGLSFEVSQNGENFSVGQRSLICLARALLRKTKVLILDEATAAVDVETDDLIQKTIRTEFKDRTILTIAHRIKTIMDSDKVLVLDKGRVQEYESPEVLLQRKNSLFRSLAQQAGEI